jgi:hypothetical protein
MLKRAILLPDAEQEPFVRQVVPRKCRIDPFVFFPPRPIMVSAFAGGTKTMKNPPIKTALFFLLLSSVLLTNLQAADTLLPVAPSKYVTDNASVLKANTTDRLSGFARCRKVNLQQFRSERPKKPCCSRGYELCLGDGDSMCYQLLDSPRVLRPHRPAPDWLGKG